MVRSSPESALPNETLVLLRVAAPVAATRGSTFERRYLRLASATLMSARERSTELLTCSARAIASANVNRVVPVTSRAGAICCGAGATAGGAVCANAAVAAVAKKIMRVLFNGHSVSEVGC